MIKSVSELKQRDTPDVVFIYKNKEGRDFCCCYSSEIIIRSWVLFCRILDPIINDTKYVVNCFFSDFFLQKKCNTNIKKYVGWQKSSKKNLVAKVSYFTETLF